jgi:hypothetical protein
MSDDFTFRHRPMRQWLPGLLAASIAITVAFSPAFWLCVSGVALFATATLANSARTGQWFSRQVGGSLSWFEGWAGASGAVLTLVLLVAIFVRIWLAA